MSEIESPELIIKLRKMDITNYFILGSLESIRNFLGMKLLIATIGIWNYECFNGDVFYSQKILVLTIFDKISHGI